MKPLEKYLQLIETFPDWFKNTGDLGEIKIITDEKRILAEQKKIRNKLKKEASLFVGLI